MVVGSPIVLNLVPGGVMKMVHVNQADKNIDIQFQIMNGNQPYNIPEGWTGTIRGTKGDAFGYSAAVTVTAGSNVVTVHLKEQLTAVAGVGNIFELVFASTSAKVSTENFILAVERSALNDETVISESDLVYANQVLNQLQSVAAVDQQVQQNKANIATETATRAAADTTLQNNINTEAAARQAADQTLQSNINAEASTRATADASLQSQIDQLVAPSGEAPSAAEVLNARIGADGVTYPTLGDAIRTNDTELKSQINAINTGTCEINMGFVQGIRYSDSPTTVSTSSTRCTAQKPISMGANDVIEITIPSGLKAGVITTLGTDSGWKTSSYTFKTTAACDVYLNAAKTSDGGVVPSEISGVIIRYTDNSSRISTLERDYEKTEDAFNDLGIIFPVENPGYISGTGTIVPDSSANLAVHTDMLPVNIGDSLQIELRYTEEHSLWAAYALYRADGTYITRISLTSDTTASEFLGTVTIGNASAKFISFTYRTFGEANAIVYKRSVPYNSELATLIPANSTYPSIDTTAKTFTIPVDTVLIDKRLTNGYAAIPATVCDYSSISSTAIMFAWDVDNATVTAMAYGAQPNYEKHIILCTLRTTKGLVGSAIPIMVDGQLYGKVNLDHINQGSVWKNENIKGINHRGYTVVAPENTLPAFKLSKDMGFEYVETDVRFTSDGVPVLLHDATINRTARNSDGTEISGTVNIADITYAQASSYDYGIWKGSAYAGTPIPTFAQFLKACRRLGLRPYIELKAGTQAQVEGLVDTAIASGFKGLCTWISYNDEYLTYVKNHASGERLGLVADTYSSALINTINSLKTPDNEVFLDMTVLSPINSTVVEALISAGIALECFINGNYSIIGANSYITGITTDSGNVGQYMYTLWSHNIYT